MIALYRETALKKALSQVGVKEHPAGTNRGPQVDRFEAVTGAYGQPWCASFVQWCFLQAGHPQPFFSRSAYVPYFVSTARKLDWVVHDPKPGDLACYDWEHNGVADHIGFVKTAPDHRGNFHAVEGNTAVGNDSNGGEVMVRERNVSQVQAFIRVPGGIQVKKPKPAPKPKPHRGDLPGPSPKPKWFWKALKAFVKQRRSK